MCAHATFSSVTSAPVHHRLTSLCPQLPVNSLYSHFEAVSRLYQMMLASEKAQGTVVKGTDCPVDWYLLPSHNMS